MKILIIYFIIINLVTFFVFGIDKRKAIKQKWRISEFTLIMLCVIGGSFGGLLGMKVFRHKTKHSKFYIGVPLIIIIQLIICGIILYKYLLS